MNRRTSALAVIALVIMPATSQSQTVIESSSGTSSIVLKDGGTAAINFGDASVKLGFTRVVSTDPWRLGATIKVKANNGFAQLFGQDTKPQGEAQLSLGYIWDKSTPIIAAQWATVSVSHTRATLSLATANGTNIARHDSAFAGTVVTGYYNAALATDAILPGDVLFGIAGGWGGRNNYGSDTLTKVSVCQVSNVSQAATPYSMVQRCKDGKTGPYAERNEATGSVDLFWLQSWLRNRVGIDLMGRYDGIDTGRPFTPGVGLFLTEKGSPLNVLGGLTIEWQGGGRPITGFQVGIPF